MKNLPEGAGSPISRMPQQQKAGYGQHTSPIYCIPQFFRTQTNPIEELKRGKKI
jgi:hypothetical protein